ncbi:aminodeoxychorismate/anthranilate synthase component II, partial [uncultured Desulfovibrio sp.]|uniref:anthranilate synthase component II n=1 Tax=uncultured Desulfovibrio sp. TaxID=167968 RepID=UPI00263AE3DF
MFLLIDNHDSFTYNLVQAFYGLGREPVVLANDDPALPGMAEDPALAMVCISPGPGRPERAGLCPEFLRRLEARAPSVPVLGVCLGHQLLGLHAGADIALAPDVMHGKQSDIVHDGKGLFEGLPNPLTVGRYHSLVVRLTEAADRRVEVTARGPEGEVMALRYRDRPWAGVQFHPESVLTPDGIRLLANFPAALGTAAAAPPDMAAILERLAAREDLTADMAAQAGAALRDGRLTPARAGGL